MELQILKTICGSSYIVINSSKRKYRIAKKDKQTKQKYLTM